MTGLPASAVELAIEVGRIASMSGRIEERAEALLEPLRRLIHFEAAAVMLFDPVRGTYGPVVISGYDEASAAYLRTPEMYDEMRLLELNRPQPPMRLCDVPFPPQELRVWADYLAPAGFREGISVGLVDSDGTHLGLLLTHTDTATPPSDGVRELLGALAPVIAQAVDPRRTFVELSRIVAGALAGVVLTRAGDPLPLPGLPLHPLLAVDSPVLAVAGQAVREGHRFRSFLCPDRTSSGSGYLRVTVLASASPARLPMVAAVILSPPGDLWGVTPRELEILGLLVEGWPNQRMAAELFIAERTVAAHVEHILAKLRTPSRTLAAVRALRLGLYVPRPLVRISRKVPRART
ncbi:LuxR C-terminal-related transcriptional regulator [Micromonospora sp. NPDC049559]|uniref:helix-turn-helix transcriptional regulator n=1 Tax=Micromonospora sp. NPDC049559 TaxID=3155923 RepID=UPI003412B8E9